jgi:hypothetical protein
LKPPGKRPDFFFFGRISGAARRKPGYPLVSFLPTAKKDTASIPCAAEKRRPCRFSVVSFLLRKKIMEPLQPASMPDRALLFYSSIFISYNAV